MGFAFNFSFGVGAGAAASILTPADIFGANYLYDWNPDISASLSTSSGAVNSIASVGLNTAAFTQTGAARPQLVANQINGKPVIRFDGVTSFMTIASSTSLFNFLHNATGGTVILVIKTDNASASRRILNNKTIASTAGGGFYFGRDAGGNSQIVTFNNTAIISANNSGAFLNQYESFLIINDASNATLIDRTLTYKNNGSVIKNNTFSGTFANINAARNLHLGIASDATATYLNGDIARIIIVDTKATPTQQAQVAAYLEYEYGTFPI